MVLDRQLNLFEPIAASIALRDTPYNSTAHALAELVDNSIDAQARGNRHPDPERPRIHFGGGAECSLCQWFRGDR